MTPSSSILEAGYCRIACLRCRNKTSCRHSGIVTLQMWAFFLFFLCLFLGWHHRNAVQSVGLPTQSHQVLSETSEGLRRQRAEKTKARLGHPTDQRPWELQRTLPSHACQGEWCLRSSQRMRADVPWLQFIEHLWKKVRLPHQTSSNHFLYSRRWKTSPQHHEIKKKKIS